MRVILATLALLALGATLEPAKADPYKWCADYGNGDQGGSTNCYFLTIEQCRAAISGMGGFCRENGFYDGRPVGTPAAVADAPRSRKKKHPN